MKHCGAPCFLLYQLMVVALDIYALAQGQESKFRSLQEMHAVMFPRPSGVRSACLVLVF